MTTKEAIEILKRATMFEPTLDNRDYPEAFDLAIKALEERPQGEWIITQDEKFYHYKCQFCGFWATGDFLRTNDNLDLPNFCERCGARLMRGEEE